MSEGMKEAEGALEAGDVRLGAGGKGGVYRDKSWSDPIEIGEFLQILNDAWEFLTSQLPHNICDWELHLLQVLFQIYQAGPSGFDGGYT